MNRGASSAFQTEVAKQANSPFHLVEIHFDDESIYLNDTFKSITYDSNTYTPSGDFLGFSDIEESAELSVSSVTLSLSGVDKTWVSKFLTKNYLDRTVKIYKGFLDTSQDLIIDPLLIFEGRINAPIISESPANGELIVALDITNTWVDFSRISGRRTNHEEQQKHFSGDKGFEFSGALKTDITWGNR